jgi:hypothetical protein
MLLLIVVQFLIGKRLAAIRLDLLLLLYDGCSN